MNLNDYKTELENRELSSNTIAKYLGDVKAFLEFTDGAELNQEIFIQYKEYLKSKYKTNSVNSKVTVINNFLAFKGIEAKVKQERVQKHTTLDNVLSEKDYARLIRMVETRGKDRARMTMIALRYTGLRVSELEYLTVEAVKKGYIDINNKGKHRRVAICTYLSKELKKYIKAQGITSGAIIVNSKGEPLSRGYVFKELKWIAGQARVKKDKVYPHSFRHLFAKWWLSKNGNNTLALADILGHSSLDTTRIYTTLSTAEQRETMEA